MFSAFKKYYKILKSPVFYKRLLKYLEGCHHHVYLCIRFPRNVEHEV